MAHQKWVKRVDFWDLLERINPRPQIGWCVLGNFNEITSQDEKVGGKLRPRKQMEDFRMAFESNGLIDLG